MSSNCFFAWKRTSIFQCAVHVGILSCWKVSQSVVWDALFLSATVDDLFQRPVPFSLSYMKDLTNWVLEMNEIVKHTFSVRSFCFNRDGKQ